MNQPDQQISTLTITFARCGQDCEWDVEGRCFVHNDKCIICGHHIQSSDNPIIHVCAEGDDGLQHLGLLCGDCRRLSEEGLRTELWALYQTEQEKAKHHRELGQKLAECAAELKRQAEFHLDQAVGYESIILEELRMISDARFEWDKEKFQDIKSAISTPKDITGYVYLLGSPEGYCKIGRAKHLSQRLLVIGLQLPWRVEILHSIPVSDPVWAERELHKKFAACRVNGEWFLLSDSDINWIKALTTLEP